MVANRDANPVRLFPTAEPDASESDALLSALSEDQQRKLGNQGVRALMRVPFSVGETGCEFCCESRTPQAPHFELHAAAELFAQMFAMRLEIEQLTTAKS